MKEGGGERSALIGSFIVKEHFSTKAALSCTLPPSLPTSPSVIHFLQGCAGAEEEEERGEREDEGGEAMQQRKLGDEGKPENDEVMDSDVGVKEMEDRAEEETRRGEKN